MNTKTLDSTKIYWLDKEETVKAKLVGLDLPNGFGSVKYTFRVIHGGTGDIVYMDSNLPKTIHEVVEQKQWQFTTPIAMKCTEEQFNEIKDRLVEMGYKLSISRDLIDGIWLVNNFGGVSNCFGLACGTPFQKTKFNSFNPDLFLALAAMTDKEDGIKGEVYTNSCGKFYTKDDEKEGKWHNTFWRKATAQEIIEHFERKEFLLPKFWHVVVTEENVDVLSKWRFGEEYPKHKLNIGYIVGFSSWQNSKQHNPSDSRGSFGSEITFDQFKKYVLKETEQSCQKTPVVGSIEYTVNVEFDAEKAAEELFAKIVEFGKSSQPEYKFTTESWHINDKKEIVLEDKTIIPIPPSKQATLFDDRVEITDWKPKEGQLIYYIIVSNFGNIKYRAEIYNSLNYQKESLANGFIKRTESEAKQLVEKLKQAML